MACDTGSCYFVHGSGIRRVVHASGFSAEDLRSKFTHPPAEARSTGYWAWVDGNASKEGITADLESMKAKGMSGAYAKVISQGYVEGDALYGSENYLAMIEHALSEGARLGMEMGFHNAPGWSGSGGPGTPPEEAMKRLLWTETPVAGGQRIDITLPCPDPRNTFYADVALLAVPEDSLQGDLLRLPTVEFFSGGQKLDPANLFNGGWEHGVVLPDGILEVRFAEPVSVASIAAAAPRGGRPSHSIVLEPADANGNFVQVGLLEMEHEPAVPSFFSGATNLTLAKGRVWRLHMRHPNGSTSEGFQLGWLTLHGSPARQPAVRRL